MVVDQDFFKISFFLRRVGLVDQDGRPPSRHFVLVGRPKLWWNANFVTRGRNPLVVSCSSDVQNWGEMRIGLGRLATLSSFRAHRTSKTVVKCKFVTSTVNPLVTSCWSDVGNCGKMLIFACRGLPRTSCAGFIHFGARRCSKTCILKCGMARRCSETHILFLLDEPSRRIRWVDGTKPWRNANFLWKLSEASRETFVLEALFYEIWRKPRTKRSFWKLVLWNFEEASHETFALEALFYEIWRMPRTKRSFWKLVLWNFEEASHETFVLEALFYEIWRKPRTKRSFWKLCSMKFGRSLARNVRFGSLFYEISRKPRTKRSFWKLVLWNLKEASHETFVLEACSVKFRGSLARNVRFGSFVLWNLEEASHETLVLEACSMRFRGSLAQNVRFGSLFCEILRKPRTKRSFWKLVLWNLKEASHETLVLEACSMKFRGSLAQNVCFASFFCEISRKPRTKRSFWQLVLWNFEEASHETIVLEAFSVKIVGSIVRNARFGSLLCEISKKPRTKRSFWKLFLWKLSEASRETRVLEASSVKFRGSLARNDRFRLWNLVLVAAFSYEGSN